LSCNALVDESDEIVPDSKADEENAISSTTWVFNERHEL
jgi:hypothetical protein